MNATDVRDAVVDALRDSRLDPERAAVRFGWPAGGGRGKLQLTLVGALSELEQASLRLVLSQRLRRLDVRCDLELETVPW